MSDLSLSLRSFSLRYQLAVERIVVVRRPFVPRKNMLQLQRQHLQAIGHLLRQTTHSQIARLIGQSLPVMFYRDNVYAIAVDDVDDAERPLKNFS